jgi:ABC-type amino acid transport substrate-binding protein
MKLKSTILLAAFCILITAGCNTKKPAPIEKLSDLQGKVIGTLSTGISAKGYEAMITRLIGGAPKEVLFYNRTMDMVLALSSGKIDGLPCQQISVNYLLQRNPDLKAIPVTGNIAGGVIMAVRSEDQKLKEDIDKAITTLQENGTLKALEEKWITNFPAKDEPAANEIPKIENAKTIYVGISGDLVPLDYISANGRPAGFNVALLTEISKIININFEFVSIESQSRFTALKSKKIDLIFCHFQSSNTNLFDELKSNNWISTKPYFNYKGGSFIVKK